MAGDFFGEPAEFGGRLDVGKVLGRGHRRER
jgi:hypothetical protein